ncbi:uncharacterized protein LOC133038666 isoform X1 [Cannabis sativa]|uniref:uncharacterized protein LOC133038666 isoform X1 n=2 Tax=Cannabis sativa TaxID=3483 RepID=UPI0029CA1A5B|nr:uncharacterized protein LOC133038666 isoform X1 [Cannabis sativa]
MAEMAEVVDEIREGKCLLAADTDKKETDLSYSSSSGEEEKEDNDYDSQDEDEDEKITKSRELKASLPVSDSSDEEDDEYEQDWAIVNKQLIETDGFHVDYLPNQHKRNWYQKILGISSCKYAIDAANLAIAEYNKLEGANLELREIINVMYEMTGGLYYALTLQCTDGKYYEVKVLKLGPKIDLEMFRPAKHYPRPTTTTTTTSSEEEEAAAASK